MIVIICLTIILLIVLLHITTRSRTSAKLIYRIPGPTPLPFIGNLLMFNIPTDKLWDMIFQLLEDYNPRARAWIFNLKIVFTRDLDDIKTILLSKNNLEKCKRLVYNGIRDLDNDGLFTNTGDKRHQRRKLISSAFSPEFLKAYTEIINEHAERLINKNLNMESTLINTVQVFLKFSFGVIWEAALGIDGNSLGVEDEEKYIRCMDETCGYFFYRSVRPYLKDWMMKLSNSRRQQNQVIKSFRQSLDGIIQERRDYHQKIGYQQFLSKVDDVEDANNSGAAKKRLALLDLLLAAETETFIDERGLKEEVEVLLFAGYETIGVALAFTLMLLAENKAVQDVAREEVAELFERTGSVLKTSDLSKLDYLERCIKESLRLYPTSPIIGRHITENTKFGDYEIPKGTEVVLHLLHLHRDPKYWPHPEKFDPDRFLPENTNANRAYYPFSTGPRMCIGMKLAMLELKVTLARILYEFYIEPVDFLENLKLKIHITLRPKTTCRVRLIRINRKSTA